MLPYLTPIETLEQFMSHLNSDGSLDGKRIGDHIGFFLADLEKVKDALRPQVLLGFMLSLEKNLIAFNCNGKENFISNPHCLGLSFQSGKEQNELIAFYENSRLFSTFPAPSGLSLNDLYGDVERSAQVENPPMPEETPPRPKETHAFKLFEPEKKKRKRNDSGIEMPGGKRQKKDEALAHSLVLVEPNGKCCMICPVRLSV